MTSVELAPELYLNRELAWIDFNQRVLAQAMDPRTPVSYTHLTLPTNREV